MWHKLKEIIYLFDAHDKKKLLWLTVCMTGVGLVELVVVAAIFPFLAIATQPQIVKSNAILSHIYSLLPVENTNQFVIMLGIGILILLIVGNIFSVLTAWFSLNISHFQGHKIAVKLFTDYLHQPYHFFFKRHSAVLTKNVIVETQRLVVGILVPGLQAFSKLVSTLLILGLLIFVDPLLVLSIMGVFSILYFMMYKAIRLKLKKESQLFSAYAALRQQSAVEGLGIIKEIQLVGRQEHFIQQFSTADEGYFGSEAKVHFVPHLTKYILETLAFSAVIGMIIYLLAFGQNFIDVIPLLGSYALAGYRLLPATQQIFNGLAQVLAHWESVRIIREDFGTTTVSAIAQKNNYFSKMHFSRDIILENVDYGYETDDQNKKALDNINIIIPAQGLVAFVGKTGSGKSSTADIILGLLTPTAGKLLIDSEIISEDNKRFWQNNIGYVPQEIFLVDDTIEANIAFGVDPSEINKEWVLEAAKMANIDEFIVNELSEGFNTKIGEKGIRLSGGQRQRIGIARALYHQPQVLVLDEATSALDSVTEAKIMESVLSLVTKKTIILIAHRLSTVEKCDKIFVFEQGKIIAEGNYAGLLAHCSVFKELAKVA